MQSISIVVPVFNEEKAIKKTIDDIKNITEKLRYKINIIAVNDCSTDKTSQILSLIKGITVITHETNKGYGASLKSAIKKINSDYILIIDADGTYPVSAIPSLISQAKNYDMVIGARTGKIVKIPFFRKPAKWILKHFAEYLTKTRIPDLNSGLRIFRRDIALRFMGFFPDGFSFTTTLTIACLTNDYSVKFVTIDYYERKGTSTIHPIKDFVGFVNLIFRLTIYFKPLNVFLPISLFILLLGVAKVIRDFVLFQYFGIGGVTAILAGIQIAFLGIIADLIINRTRI